MRTIMNEPRVPAAVQSLMPPAVLTELCLDLKCPVLGSFQVQGQAIFMYGA